MAYLKKHAEFIIDILLLALVYFYLLQYFPFNYILSDTVITGGDTGSHYKTAVYLKEVLLPQGKIIGWYPGNYGGYPLFIMYFPLLYLLAVGLSEWMALTVSFKIVTLIGPFLLPICTYVMVKCCRFRFPGPGLAACGSVVFLLNTSNSMWGGNLYSTLAGEFSYSVSFSLTFAFLGVLYRLVDQIVIVKQKMNWWLLLIAILLLFMIGLTHGFTLIICSLSALYFLLHPKYFVRKGILILVVFGVGGFLFSGWFIQLFLNAPYTTPFDILWTFASVWEVLPQSVVPILALFFVYSLYALIPAKSKWQLLSWPERKVVPFLWFIILLSVFCYLNADTLKLPDIRFIPFVQFLVTIWGCAFLALLSTNRFVLKVLPFIGFCTMVLWLNHYTNNAKGWTAWNYRGFENAPRWEDHRAIIFELAGRYEEPRVAYEHNSLNNGMGTVRTFESLPYFAGRATLEGLYFQSSLLSPFVFYTQSLYSKQISCPFPEYPCSRFDLERAGAYLELLNVNQLILVSDHAKNQARTLPNQYRLQKKIAYSPYELWQLNHSTGYVTILETPPQFVEPENFRHKFYNWFRSYSPEGPFLYTVPIGAGVLGGIINQLNAFDQIPVPQSSSGSSLSNERKATSDCQVIETIKKESLHFKTNCPGKPHLVKVAYNPGWQVEGGDGPYLVSPAFILVYPHGEEVHLQYDNHGPRSLGLAMTWVGIGMFMILVIIALFPKFQLGVARLRSIGDVPILNYSGFGFFLLLFVFLLGLGTRGIINPGYQASFKKYERFYTVKDYDTAQKGFKEITERWKHQPTIDKIYYFLGLSYYLDQKCDIALEAFQEILAFRDSEYLAEAYYHLGLCSQILQKPQEAKQYYHTIIDQLRDPSWSIHATARLKELPK